MRRGGEEERRGEEASTRLSKSRLCFRVARFFFKKSPLRLLSHFFFSCSCWSAFTASLPKLLSVPSLLLSPLLASPVAGGTDLPVPVASQGAGLSLSLDRENEVRLDFFEKGIRQTDRRRRLGTLWPLRTLGKGPADPPMSPFPDRADALDPSLYDQVVAHGAEDVGLETF